MKLSQTEILMRYDEVNWLRQAKERLSNIIARPPSSIRVHDHVIKAFGHITEALNLATAFLDSDCNVR